MDVRRNQAPVPYENITLYRPVNRDQWGPQQEEIDKLVVEN